MRHRLRLAFAVAFAIAPKFPPLPLALVSLSRLPVTPPGARAGPRIQAAGLDSEPSGVGARRSETGCLPHPQLDSPGLARTTELQACVANATFALNFRQRRGSCESQLPHGGRCGPAGSSLQGQT